MNIDASFRYDVAEVMQRDGCSYEHAVKKLTDEFERRQKVEWDALTPEQQAAKTAEQERFRREREEVTRDLLKAFKERYGDKP